MKNLEVLDNPYYIDAENMSYFPAAKRRINYFTIKALYLLCGPDTVDPSVIKSNWRNFTLPDNVYYAYNKDGVKKYNEYVGQKLEIFINALDKPENREALQNSFFNEVIKTLFSESYWENYELKSNCNPTFKGKNSLTGALLAYREETLDANNNPLDFGLNLDHMFDKILAKNKKGEWIIKDTTDINDRNQITEAVETFVWKTLQQSKSFVENYEETERESE